MSAFVAAGLSVKRLSSSSNLRPSSLIRSQTPSSGRTAVPCKEVEVNIKKSFVGKQLALKNMTRFTGVQDAPLQVRSIFEFIKAAGPRDNPEPVGPIITVESVVDGCPSVPIPGDLQDSPQSSKSMLVQFGAGCFWSVELVFQRIPGVLRTAVGYTQGTTKNPWYRDVCADITNHVEAVLVEYDPATISLDELLDVFWAKHDPTTPNRQGNDAGSQYRSGVYYYTEDQKKAIEKSLAAAQKNFSRPIVTEVLPAKDFYYAEDYHQQYLAKGGRWGKPQSPEKMCNDPIRCYG
mmetsp:Transcript_19239/g.33032  ORF Transcript_19239/g.33032 Transcript_19239/m.33032 type:complete len:292 (-) Transcript_19239:793-1668(-)|eukprot:CAMPEP_0196660650 /NCGR_PEP_ID=MMETSP1086-20130531/40810_1 /TAXON_ID=77921 /ORGANISM="Cyanoptyche  gloeocystis , Strain SAG4.97" /LENGTH=291 /DNA_ID=CAMNT_0041995183 /DNA_START=75 /DNA_END=950 /DNA_ORIENTATION=+